MKEIQNKCYTCGSLYCSLLLTVRLLLSCLSCPHICCPVQLSESFHPEDWREGREDVWIIFTMSAHSDVVFPGKCFLLSQLHTPRIDRRQGSQTTASVMARHYYEVSAWWNVCTNNNNPLPSHNFSPILIEKTMEAIICFTSLILVV